MIQCMICEDWFHSQVRENRIEIFLNDYIEAFGCSITHEENEADQMI